MRLHLAVAGAVLAALLLAPAVSPVTPASSAAVPYARVYPQGVLGADRPAAVELSASGLAPSTYYDIAFDGGYLRTSATDGSGRIDTTGLDLPGATCGDHAVTLTRAAVILQLAAPQPDATAGYRVLCPSIGVSPRRVPQGTLPATYTVAPSADFDYAGNDQYKQLFLDGAPLMRVGYHDPISFTAAPACGPHTVRLVQPSSFGVLDASATLTVLCPAVGLDPAVITRSSQPRPVTVSATGFDPKQPVSVSIDGVVLAGGLGGELIYTDGAGAVTTTVPATDLDCGAHTVAVTELRPVPPPSAVATLTVRCPGPGRAARVTLDPAVVSAGMTTRITGSGFPPGATVTLRWRLPDGSTASVSGGPAKADATGRISLTTLVMAHDPTGARELLATVAGQSATAPAVVQGGTMQPSGGSGQIVFRR